MAELDPNLVPEDLVEFRVAVVNVKKLAQRPGDEELLKLYSLFKQAVFGDNTTDKPGIFDLKGRYKWDAWSKLKGMTKEAAQEAYIEHAKSLIAKYGLRKE